MDLGLTYSYNIGPVQIFVKPQVLNVFNSQHIVAANTHGQHDHVHRSNELLTKFNPFTTTLIECPQSATTAPPSACKAPERTGRRARSSARPAATSQLPDPPDVPDVGRRSLLALPFHEISAPAFGPGLFSFGALAC